MEIIYKDNDIVVCIKSAGVVSTDEPGGMPDLIRAEIGEKEKQIFTIHRLDRAVSGLMVYAFNTSAAGKLSGQITDKSFEKDYLAVVHGVPEEAEGRFDDLLFKDASKNKTFVVDRVRKGVRDAALEYKVLESVNGLTLVRIHLLTGRTHQIRVQFSSRKMPLYGDGKYGAGDKGGIALFSCCLRFRHPKTEKDLLFEKLPCAETYPWSIFCFNN